MTLQWDAVQVEEKHFSVGNAKGLSSDYLRGGDVLECLAGIDIVALDKTGTLTEGKPTVTAIASSIYSETEILQLAAAVEKTTCHPISRAILNKAEILKLQLPSIIGQLTEPGSGTMAEVDGSIVAVGTMDWVNERFQRKLVAYELMDLENCLGDLSYNGISLLNQSTSIVYMGREDEGIICATAISDILRCKINNEEDVFIMLLNLNVNELIKAFAVKTNDMMLVIYLSALIRSIIALHNLINN